MGGGHSPKIVGGTGVCEAAQRETQPGVEGLCLSRAVGCREVTEQGQQRGPRAAPPVASAGWLLPQL